MTRLYFRDLRRRLDRLEHRYPPPRPMRVDFEYIDDDGKVEVWDSFVVGGRRTKRALRNE